METYGQLFDENARLRAQVAAQDEQISELQARLLKLEALVEQQAAVIQQQAAEIERLKRRGKRQAAPFSKGDPKIKPKKPGRKKGKDHGPCIPRSPRTWTRSRNSIGAEAETIGSLRSTSRLRR
jgi:TolA-binding protein